MTRVRKVVLWLAGAILFALAFALFVVGTPSQAPSQSQLDFLAIVAAVSMLEEQLAAQGPEVTDHDLKATISASGDLIRSIEVQPDRAVLVSAIMVPRSPGRRAPPNIREPVRLRFQLVQEGGKTERRCFGQPQSAVPSFCGAL